MNLKKILREEIESALLTEVLITEIPTQYTKSLIYKSGEAIEQWKFKSKSNTDYDLDFHFYIESGNNMLNNGKYLMEILNDVKLTYNVISISFTIGDLSPEDRNTPIYNQATNKFEQWDVMGRIAYLVGEFIKQSPTVKIYSVSLGTHITKMKLYDAIYKSLYENNFTKFEGESDYYDIAGCTYFIKSDYITPKI